MAMLSTMDNEDLLAEMKVRLQEVFGARLHSLVLYGSQARGEARPESDIDVLVLLDEPVSLGSDLSAIVHAIYPLQLELDRSISALPVPYRSFQAGEFALYRNAKKEGIFA